MENQSFERENARLLQQLSTVCGTIIAAGIIGALYRSKAIYRIWNTLGKEENGSFLR